jgi:hypothetical protein
MDAKRRTYGEVDGFVNMLLAACEDSSINDTLEMLLSMPDDRRRAVIERLLERLREQQAPQELREAMACLLDNVVAEKAYEVIYECARKLKSR